MTLFLLSKNHYSNSQNHKDVTHFNYQQPPHCIIIDEPLRWTNYPAEASACMRAAYSISTGHNLQAHKMQRILSFQVTSIQERITWAFSVKTENINQKLLLCFLASISDELNYFEWPFLTDDRLIKSLSNMTDSDIGHAYNGLLRIGLVSFCRWDCNVNTLNIENKKGAEF